MTQPALVEVTGGLDLSTVVRWEAQVAKASSASRTIVLDLSRVEFLDSAGVHGLFRMLATLADRGKRLIVVAPRGGRARRLLEILDVSSLAWICESRDEALGSARL
jgi:anti-anti-sigma factor